MAVSRRLRSQLRRALSTDIAGTALSSSDALQSTLLVRRTKNLFNQGNALAGAKYYSTGYRDRQSKPPTPQTPSSTTVKASEPPASKSLPSGPSELPKDQKVSVPTDGRKKLLAIGGGIAAVSLGIAFYKLSQNVTATVHHTSPGFLNNQDRDIGISSESKPRAVYEGNIESKEYQSEKLNHASADGINVQPESTESDRKVFPDESVMVSENGAGAAEDGSKEDAASGNVMGMSVEEDSSEPQQKVEEPTTLGQKIEEVISRSETPDLKSDNQHVETIDHGLSGRPSLSDLYLLQRSHDANVKSYDEREKNSVHGFDSEENQENLKDMGANKLTKFQYAVDHVAAIHAAEQRQAESDKLAFEEHFRTIEEKHRQQLKDLQATMVMYAERADHLEKELLQKEVEHAKHLQMSQEKSEERMQIELLHQEDALKRQVQETEIRAKAEAAASIAEERISLLNDISLIKEEIEALNMVFNAKSDEARHKHTLHNLSLGTFALENAIMDGAPVENVVNLLITSVGGSGADPLVDAAISSLPKESMKASTSSRIQLYEQFLESKQQLRQLALIPASGGGILSHSLAWLASMLKVKEHEIHETSGGVEALLGLVDKNLKEGKLVEAADVLEKGMSGTKGEAMAAQWSKQVRNYAIIEQVCAVLRAHATTISLSLS